MSAALALRTLVLNADFSPIATWPLSLIPAKDGVKAVLVGNATVLEEWDAVLRSPSIEVRVPKVVALKEYAPIHSSPKFCRASILLRDRYKCFAAGTRVLMANGRQEAIENIRVGDRVIDAFGHPVTVVNTGARIADDCVSIKHRGSFERTTVTSDHPYLDDNGAFTPIGEFPIGERKGGGRSGGYLRGPRVVHYELPPGALIDLTSYLPSGKWFRVRDGRVYRSRHEHASGMPTVIRQSPDLAYLMGLFVAEGSTNDAGQIVFSFCEDEKDTLAADASRLLMSVFGIKSWTALRPDKHTCIVGCSDKTLAEVIWNLCGKGARNKTTPWDLIGPYHADYLRGLFMGDAHIDHKRKKIALTMTGFGAVFGAQSMLWGLGIHPTLQHLTIQGKQPILTLVLNGDNRTRFVRDVLREEAEDGEVTFGDASHVYRRLQERTPVEGDVVVYNIETDGSHSYTANGLSVHNCQYCGERFQAADLTFDHVIPRSRGGRTTWENILSACVDCNTRKSNSMPNYSGRRGQADGGLRPLKAPRQPTTAELLRAGLELLDSETKETYGDFLYWNVPLKA